MGWSHGFDSNWNRDIGYGVPAICDHPRCKKPIDRGLAYVCGGEPEGGEHGCGLFFCGEHMAYGPHAQNCPRCLAYKPPYKHPKPDTTEWMRWKLAHKSWQEWRVDNQEEVAAMYLALGKQPPCRPFNLPHGSHDFTNGECGRCGKRRRSLTPGGEQHG